MCTTQEVPWPKTMVKMMKILEFTSLDMYVVFGEVSCHVSTHHAPSLKLARD